MTHIPGFTDEDQARWDAAMGSSSSNGGDQKHNTEQEAEEPPALPQLMTARRICELPDPPASDELLGPLFTRGNRVVIGAHTGAGKTTLTKQVVRTIVNGGEFLGWNTSGCGRALIIDAEQGLRTIKLRLREAGLDKSDQVDYLRVPDGLTLDCDERQVTELEAILAAGRYDIVSADPLYKLHRGDSNDERAGVDLMRQFDAWREQHHFLLMISVHCRKPPAQGARFTMHEFFGTSAYLRGAEVVLGLQRLSDGYSKLHIFKDRDGDLGTQDWGLLFNRESGFRLDPEGGKRKETTKDKIHDLLTVNPGMSTTQLVKATGSADRTVRGALGELKAISKTGVDGEKFWRLANETEAEADA